MNAPLRPELLQTAAPTRQGIGQRLPRKEDRRFLLGRGQFIGDIRMPDMLDVAFLRSPVAHARLGAIHKPEGMAALVYTMADLLGVKPIMAASALPGFKVSAQYPLAHEKVRFVGEPVVACIAPTRAQAEDIVAQVVVDYDELPVLHEMTQSVDASARVHDEWANNVFVETNTNISAKSGAAPAEEGATLTVRRQLRTSRQCMMPMEGRAVLCWWDHRLDQLVMYSAAQMPHINRTGLAECLGLDEGQIRVISPDVGGGFGYKGILLPEEICCAWLARHLGRPVRWLEDRREQLGANANCREHAYDIAVEVDRSSGRLIGIDCDAMVDSGAYSSYPFGACLESAQVGSILPGPYRMDRFRCRTRSVATNKPPILPYRGVARTGVCFALELTLDAAARELGIEPWALRAQSLVPASAMPYTNITNKFFDSGDYQTCMMKAVDLLDWSAWRARQATAPAGQRIGLGLAVFCEQGAHGTSVYHAWGIPMVPGYEQCAARFTPDGVLEVRIGVHSHGQGMETSMAQIAHTVLGIDTDQVRVQHGDTAASPYSTGTWGSRSAVMAGGAVGTACAALARRVIDIAAALLNQPAAALQLSGGRVGVPGSPDSLSLKDIAHAWYRAPQKIPAGIDAAGLEVVVGYKTAPDTGTFSYACHACAVQVDTATGRVTLLDYAICEDGGVLLNPQIVEGQLIGGLAQGIGTALYEESPFDAEAQPLASTLADYLMPGAGEMPPLKIVHMETPSPLSLFGQKGIGEGGAIAPPAAIINAVNDALHALGAEIRQCPASPERVLAALAAGSPR
jgi:carbon-monoxide dehydrogenase large subunit